MNRGEGEEYSSGGGSEGKAEHSVGGVQKGRRRHMQWSEEKA